MLEYCEDCTNASLDYFEYLDGARQYFIGGCKKDCEPHYDDVDESIQCAGYESYYLKHLNAD